MVKGVSRRVIVVDSPDPQVFEQAIFILSGDGAGVSQQQLVDQAVRVARSYARTHGIPQRSFRMTPPLWMGPSGPPLRCCEKLPLSLRTSDRYHWLGMTDRAIYPDA